MTSEESKQQLPQQPEKRVLLELWLNPEGRLFVTGCISNKLLALNALTDALRIVLNHDPLVQTPVDSNKILIPPGVHLNGKGLHS